MIEINGTINNLGQVKVGIVVAQFNDLVTQRLTSGAVGQLKKLGIAEECITTVYVPGAMELPRIVQKLADSGKVDGIIALGAVVKGSTDHYQYVCSATTSGLAKASLAGPCPVMFGLLTTETMAQALDRAGGKSGNKGGECAAGLVEMLSIENQL